MNESRGDYLKVIYEEGKDQIVTNKILTEKLKVSASSVSEMLSKLAEKGLVENIPYKGCKLTPLGFEECTELVRVHRLWEVFLMRHLKFTWREAHEDAHLLEHATTERMIDRLDEFLNYPENCPHGNHIPHKYDDTTKKNKYILLANIEIGKKVTISKVGEDGELLDYLWNLGLKIGKSIQVISKGEYEGPVVIIQDEKEISISYKAATQIYTEEI